MVERSVLTEINEDVMLLLQISALKYDLHVTKITEYNPTGKPILGSQENVLLLRTCRHMQQLLRDGPMSRRRGCQDDISKGRNFFERRIDYQKCWNAN